MILAQADKNATVVLGDPKATLLGEGAPQHADGAVAHKEVASRGEERESEPTTPGQRQDPPIPPGPLTQQEIEEYSRIKCSVCGERVLPDDIASHSRSCVLAPAPNLRLQLDKWCIASTNMTVHEQRAFLHMRRTEELARVEGLEQSLKRRMTQLWWISGKFGFIMSARWLREWRSFVGVGRPLAETLDRPPPPINNNDLFELDGSLRVGLRQGIQEDYLTLEQPMWEFYVQVYGGGPAILRYNTNSQALPSINDAVATFEGDWRDLRPDTGVGKIVDPYNGCGFDGEIRGGFLWTCTGNGLLRNGSHYDGRVVRGLPDGGGREVMPDGTALEGTFRQGKLHGMGRQTDPSGRVVEGFWENGVLIGI